MSGTAGKQVRPARVSAYDRSANPPKRGKHKARKTIKGLGEASMARIGALPDAAHAAVRSLITEKLRYLVPMTVIFMVAYVGLTALAGFAGDWMGTKVVGALNLGFVLIAFNYLLSWALAILYGRIAANRFDPLAAKAAMEIEMRESGKSRRAQRSAFSSSSC
jgi:uncharacterized membrane protein (DUF485 family)